MADDELQIFIAEITAIQRQMRKNLEKNSRKFLNIP